MSTNTNNSSPSNTALIELMALFRGPVPGAIKSFTDNDHYDILNSWLKRHPSSVRREAFHQAEKIIFNVNYYNQAPSLSLIWALEQKTNGLGKASFDDALIYKIVDSCFNVDKDFINTSKKILMNSQELKEASADNFLKFLVSYADRFYKSQSVRNKKASVNELVDFYLKLNKNKESSSSRFFEDAISSILNTKSKHLHSAQEMTLKIVDILKFEKNADIQLGKIAFSLNELIKNKDHSHTSVFLKNLSIFFDNISNNSNYHFLNSKKLKSTPYNSSILLLLIESCVDEYSKMVDIITSSNIKKDALDYFLPAEKLLDTLIINVFFSANTSGFDDLLDKIKILLDKYPNLESNILSSCEVFYEHILIIPASDIPGSVILALKKAFNDPLMAKYLKSEKVFSKKSFDLVDAMNSYFNESDFDLAIKDTIFNDLKSLDIPLIVKNVAKVISNLDEYVDGKDLPSPLPAIKDYKSVKKQLKNTLNIDGDYMKSLINFSSRWHSVVEKDSLVKSINNKKTSPSLFTHKRKI